LKGIGIVKLDGRDVIRHPLVKQIIKAYEQKD
jgi:phosphate starvation-inducible protein PhoH